MFFSEDPPLLAAPPPVPPPAPPPAAAVSMVEEDDPDADANVDAVDVEKDDKEKEEEGARCPISDSTRMLSNKVPCSGFEFAFGFGFDVNFSSGAVEAVEWCVSPSSADGDGDLLLLPEEGDTFPPPTSAFASSGAKKQKCAFCLMYARIATPSNERPVTFSWSGMDTNDVVG